jgi:hypothetical protein
MAMKSPSSGQAKSALSCRHLQSGVSASVPRVVARRGWAAQSHRRRPALEAAHESDTAYREDTTRACSEGEWAGLVEALKLTTEESRFYHWKPNLPIHYVQSGDTGTLSLLAKRGNVNFLIAQVQTPSVARAVRAMSSGGVQVWASLNTMRTLATLAFYHHVQVHRSLWSMDLALVHTHSHATFRSLASGTECLL